MQLVTNVSATESVLVLPKRRGKGVMGYVIMIGSTPTTIRFLTVSGAPWVHAQDVAKSLGYVRTAQVVQSCVHPDDRKPLYELNADSFEEASYINEACFYNLVSRCPRKDFASLIQTWCVDEVFPELRMTDTFVEQSVAVQPESSSMAPTTEETQPGQDWNARHVRLQALGAPYDLSQKLGLSTASERLRIQAQEAVEEALLPEGDRRNDYIDAAQVLRERGFSEKHIARLASEFGKDLLICRGEAPHASRQSFGPETHGVNQYHRLRDAPMIEATLHSFRDRPLYQRVMAGAPDPIREQRLQRLANEGRGRVRPSCAPPKSQA